MSVLGSDMETHSASFWSFNHCFAFPTIFFYPCSRSFMNSPLFSVLQNAVLSLITRASVLPGFISDVRSAPFRCSSHMHTVYLLDSQFTLPCLVLLPCSFSLTQWARKSERPAYRVRRVIMNINVLDRRSSSSSSLPTVALLLQYMTLSKQKE